MRNSEQAFLWGIVVLAQLLRYASAQDTPNQWTNPDGKVIVGEFVRLEEQSIVLRLPTGNEVKAPFASLSLESHLQALKLGKASAFNKPLVKAPVPVPPLKRATKLTVNDISSSPFDAEPSIDSFLQTLVKEFNRGNFYIVWHMMPPRMQDDVATLVSKQMQELGESNTAQIRKLLSLLSKITAEKRDWLIDPEVTGSMPIFLDMASKASPEDWSCAVAILTDLSQRSLWDSINFTKENIPNWFASLAASFQYTSELESFKAQRLSYTVLSQSADRADVQFSRGDLTLPPVNWQKFGNIWLLPETMNNIRSGLDMGLAMSGSAPGVNTPNAAAIAPPVGANNQKQPNQMAAGMNAFFLLAIPVLTKLEQAKTKEEFKRAFQTVSALIPAQMPSPPGGIGIPLPLIPSNAQP